MVIRLCVSGIGFTHSSSVLVSTRVCAAFSPSTRTRSSHVCEIDRSSCRSVLAFLWIVVSEVREGDPGVPGCFTGEDVGVEGPRNEARRLLMPAYDE